MPVLMVLAKVACVMVMGVSWTALASTKALFRVVLLLLAPAKVKLLPIITLLFKVTVPLLLLFRVPPLITRLFVLVVPLPDALLLFRKRVPPFKTKLPVKELVPDKITEPTLVGEPLMVNVNGVAPVWEILPLSTSVVETPVVHCCEFASTMFAEMNTLSVEPLMSMPPPLVRLPLAPTA